MPDTSHTTTSTPQRSSIDMSIELERQLESDSLPGSPGQPTHSKNASNHTALDPHVLAHIVTQLRDSLAHLTQERDGLIQRLAESHTREAEFKDSLSLWAERCATVEKELETYKKKSQDDEEAITLLRSKVEESRRGLMRLQTERNVENKRMTLDLTNARSPSFPGGPRSSHRASFTPLTGAGHVARPSNFRRQPSTSSTGTSENDSTFTEFLAGLPGSLGQTLVYNDNAEGGSSVQGARRRSIFGTVQRSSASLTEGRISPSVAELESLKRELAAAKAELEETRNELTESNEAREASETCVKALRDYITQTGTGSQSQGAESMLLPPLPTDSNVKDISAAQKLPKASGWGLNFWRVDTSGSFSTSSQASVTAPRARRQSVDSHRTTGSDHDSASPSTALPLRNKFGSFFTRATSISSVTHPLPEFHQEEPILNGSDVSSAEVSEPISPAAEKAQPIFVRETAEEMEGAKGTNSNSENPVYIQDGVEHGGTLKVHPS